MPQMGTEAKKECLRKKRNGNEKKANEGNWRSRNLGKEPPKKMRQKHLKKKPNGQQPTTLLKFTSQIVAEFIINSVYRCCSINTAVKLADSELGFRLLKGIGSLYPYLLINDYCCRNFDFYYFSPVNSGFDSAAAAAAVLKATVLKILYTSLLEDSFVLESSLITDLEFNRKEDERRRKGRGKGINQKEDLFIVRFVMKRIK
uniref:Uncharacterized protein n=1 Tax=Syphacia muris TaxID=451379 RepID=A0A0N5AI53_9BILA